MNPRARVVPIAFALLVTLLLPASGLAQDDPKSGPRPQPPPAPGTPAGAPHYQGRSAGQAEVGEPAPDFELDSTTGRPIRLSSYRGRWVLMVFGDRKETVAPMARVAARLDSAGIHLLGICNEKSYFLESYARRSKFPFPLLADVTREISDLYGLYDARERFVLPGFILIGPRGTVHFALLGQTLPPEDVARLARYVAARP